MVTVAPIRTNEDYQQALKKLAKVFHAQQWTPEFDVLEVLSILVENYEARHFPMDEPDPIEAIKFRMEQEGMSQRQLARVIGYDSRVSEILNRKRRLTLKMIRKISAALGIPLGVLVQEYSLGG